jgi:hypothetical protein
MNYWQAIHLASAILNIIFSIFIIIIYVKSKFYHSYAFYFNIIFTLVIGIRNIFRLIQKDDYNGFCFFQAYLLSILDKFIQAQITSYSVINYIGVFKNEFFKDNQKQIFIFLTAFSGLYSFTLTTIFISQGLSSESFCCYIKTSAILKKILDTIFSVLLLAINLLCIIRIIVTLCKSKKQNIENKKRNEDINRHLSRFIPEIVFVTLIFLIVIFTVNKIFMTEGQKESKEIIYEILLLIMEIFYTMNKEIFKEIRRTFCCKKEDNESQIEDEEERATVPLQ